MFPTQTNNAKENAKKSLVPYIQSFYNKQILWIFQGICDKKSTDMVERLFDIIEHLTIDTFGEFGE